MSTASSSAGTSATLTDWDEEAVHHWLSNTLGFPQYHSQIIEHGISGEILALLDHEGLKEVGVHSVGQRLAILKEVYYLKVAHGVTIEPEHYVPPSEIIENASQEGLSLDRLHEMIQELGQRTRILEEENRKLHEGLSACLDELSNHRTLSTKESSLRKQPSFRWANYDSPVKSPTRPAPDPPHESPKTSPHRPEHDVSFSIPHVKAPKTAPVTSVESGRPTLDHSSSTPVLNGQGSSSSRPLNREGSSWSSNASTITPNTAWSPAGVAVTPSSTSAPGDNQVKSFKVSLDDPCWKVLPPALKKYKITDDWRQYVMFICYGSTERCLSYDEKPLLLFQKLKDANKNPVFMLRNIKDIRSPIAVAQQKQSQRLRETGGSNSLLPPSRSGSSTSHAAGVPYTRNTRLHHPPVLQPISAQAQVVKMNANGQGSGPNVNTDGLQWPDTAGGDAQADSARSKPHATDEHPTHPDVKDGLAIADGTKISYAIAIYPYMAEQEDEFDVVVDDTFIILSRTKGWWVVQRDVDGTGAEIGDAAKGWVPAGCLLETSLPPASAVSEAKGMSSPVRVPNSPNGSPQPLPYKAPILPSNIISTSFPGIALMNYTAKGDHELSLARGDVLRVFKRYNHWSYAIKEDTGDRGWVPSWFVGKYTPGAAIPSASIVPPTPTGINPTSSPPAHETSDFLDVDRPFTSGTLMNGSPLSQAFPAKHTVPPI